MPEAMPWIDIELSCENDQVWVTARGGFGERPPERATSRRLLANHLGIRALTTRARHIWYAAVNASARIDPAGSDVRHRERAAKAAEEVRQALFRDETGGLMQWLSGKIDQEPKRRNHGLLLRLILRDSRLQAFPWEEVCQIRADHDVPILVARGAPQITRSVARVRPPLRVLAVALGEDDEPEELRRRLERYESDTIEWVEPIRASEASLDGILQAIRERANESPHMVHFLGRGEIDKLGNPVFLLSRNDGTAFPAPVDHIAREIGTHFSDTRVVFLETCEGATPGARRSAAELFSEAGAASVVAYLRHPNPSETTVAMEHFYDSLLGQNPTRGNVVAAGEAARRALGLRRAAEAAMLVVHLSGRAPILFDFSPIDEKLAPKAASRGKHHGEDAAAPPPAPPPEPLEAEQADVLSTCLARCWKSLPWVAAEGALSRRYLTAALLQGAGFTLLDEEDVGEGRVLFTCRIGGEPECWAFLPVRGPRDDALARRLVQRRHAIAVLLLLDFDGHLTGQPLSQKVAVAGKDVPLVVLAAEHGELGLLDLAASAAECLDAVAASLGARPPQESARLEAAAKKHVDAFETFVDQIVRRFPEAHRRQRLLSVTRGELGRVLGRVREYRGAQVTVPRREADDAMWRLARGKVEEPSPESRGISGEYAWMPPDPLVLIGPQGVGKTSAVCRFLERRDDLPAVFLRAREIERAFDGAAWTLRAMDAPIDLAAEAAALHQVDHRPHLILCLDGLNEGDLALLRRVLSASTTGELLDRGVALVMTCWPAHWRQLFRPLLEDVTEVRLHEFDDEELSAALRARDVADDAIPSNLRELARRPALLDHILRLKDRLANRGPVSRMDVFWADLQYKAQHRWIETPGDGSALRSHLVQLVRNYQEIRRKAPGRTRALFEEVGRWSGGRGWVELDRKLLTLADFELIRVDDEGTVSLTDDAIAMAAIALLLCEELRLAPEGVGAKIERARKVLDEIGDLVEPTEATFHALGFALVFEDRERVVALSAVLCDNRNFQPLRLREFGRRMVPVLIELARGRIPAEVFENADRITREATGALTQLVERSDAPQFEALLAEPTEDEAKLIAHIATHHPWAELMGPLFAAVARLSVSGGAADEAPAEWLFSGLVEAYGIDLAPELCAVLDAAVAQRRPAPRHVLRLAEAIGHPSFALPVLSLAARARDPASILDALPSVDAPEITAALDALLVGPARRVAARKVMLDWAPFTGSALTMTLLDRFGLEVLRDLHDDHLGQLVHVSRRRGFVERLTRWVLTARASWGEARRQRGMLLFLLATAAELPARLRSEVLDAMVASGFELEENEASVLHDAPMMPDLRRAWCAALRKTLAARGAGQVRAALLHAEIAPEALGARFTKAFRAAARLPQPNFEAMTRALAPFTDLLLTGPGPSAREILTSLRSAGWPASEDNMPHHKPVVDFVSEALRYLCYRGDADALLLADLLLDLIPEALSVRGPLSQIPHGPELLERIARCCSSREASLRDFCFLCAVFSRHGGVRREVRRWMARALAAFSGDDLACALQVLADVRDHSLSAALEEVARRAERPEASALWDAFLAGKRCRRSLLTILLADYAGPNDEHALAALTTRRMPGCEGWIKERVDRMVTAGSGVEEERHASVLAAAAVQGVAVPLSFIEAIWTPQRIEEPKLLSAVLLLLVRTAPDRLPEFLAPLRFLRNSDYLEYYLGPPLRDADTEGRVALLTALCNDRSPDSMAPRLEIEDNASVFAALAERPPSLAELRAVRDRVPHNRHALLGWLAAFAHPREASIFLAELERTTLLYPAREAIASAFLFCEQRGCLAAMLDRFESDPAGSMKDRGCVHLVARLDGTFRPRIDAMLAAPCDDLRRTTFWLREALRRRSLPDKPRP